MDELKNNIPDDFWRKAFDEAAETPPARVWDSIERQLDESKGDRIIPLWGFGLASSGPVIWGTGIAAALAVLLVGWWLIDAQSGNPSAIARLKPSGRSENVAVVPVTPINSSVPKPSGQAGEAVAYGNKPANQAGQSTVFSDQPLAIQARGGSTETIAQNRITATQSTYHRMNLPAIEASTERTSSAFVPPTGRMPIASFTSGPTIAPAGIMPRPVEAVTFGKLTGKPLRLRSAGPIQRIVWFQTAELPMNPELTKAKRKIRDTWASASVMPGAFNPMVSVRSAQTAFSNSTVAYTTNTNQSSVSSRANFSVAYQASAGVQLTNRWSVESGIGYLAAHSTVETPVQVASTNFVQSIGVSRNTAVGNLYVDALQKSLSTNAAYNASLANQDKLATSNTYLSQGNYSSQTQQTLTNNYQFMQVPIQVGYQLRPRKRLSLAVLGGLLTNIFVRNTVGTDVVVTAKDGVYRPVSLAATMGARLRYRPSGQWSASLAGLYQPSLGSGTQTDSAVESRPTSTGMSFGVDYHF